MKTLHDLWTKKSIDFVVLVSLKRGYFIVGADISQEFAATDLEGGLSFF
jgi:hypothetical protein